MSPLSKLGSLFVRPLYLMIFPLFLVELLKYGIIVREAEQPGTRNFQGQVIRNIVNYDVTVGVYCYNLRV